MSFRESALTARRFLRVHYFGFPSGIILLGSVSRDAQPDIAKVLGMIVIAFCYHTFAYVSNDIIDLPIDQTQPLRSEDPLVTGRLSVRQATAIASVQIPIALLIVALLGGGLAAVGLLMLAFALMLVYNVFGKRCPLPPLTDGIQGIGWGLLAFVGSTLVSGVITLPSLLVLISATSFILLISGVHGGLRDLANDLRAGVTTTAILMNAKIEQDEVLSSRAIQAYAYMVYGAWQAILAYYLLSNVLRYSPGVQVLTCFFCLALFIVNAWYLYQVVRIVQPLRNDMISFHAVPMLLPMIFMFAPALSPPLLFTVVATFVVPLLSTDPELAITRRLIRSAGRAIR